MINAYCLSLDTKYLLRLKRVLYLHLCFYTTLSSFNLTHIKTISSLSFNPIHQPFPPLLPSPLPSVYRYLSAWRWNVIDWNSLKMWIREWIKRKCFLCVGVDASSLSSSTHTYLPFVWNVFHFSYKRHRLCYIASLIHHCVKWKTKRTINDSDCHYFTLPFLVRFISIRISLLS